LILLACLIITVVYRLRRKIPRRLSIGVHAVRIGGEMPAIAPATNAK